jgi:hypothetical protein
MGFYIDPINSLELSLKKGNCFKIQRDYSILRIKKVKNNNKKRSNFILKIKLLFKTKFE